MPPKKRTVTGSGHPQSVDGEVVEPTVGPDSPSGTVNEPADQPERVPDKDELAAASLAGLLGEVKETRERVARLEAWANPTDGPSLAEELNTLARRVEDHQASVMAFVDTSGDVIRQRLDWLTQRLGDAPGAGRAAILDGIQGIMLDVTGVGKHGQMDAAARMGNYKYQRYDDLKRELGAAFRKHDVFLQSTTTNLVTERVGDGGRMSRVLVSVTYRFTSLMDGSELTFDSHGESIDKSDKATGKAMTMALKTALIQAFMLAAEDTEDPDASRPEPDEVPREQRQQRRDETVQRRESQATERGPIARTPERVMQEAEQRVHTDQVIGQDNGRGYPDDGPRRDAWDTGPVVDQRTPGELAAAAVAKLNEPGLTMAKWSAISEYAKDQGIYETMVTTPDGAEMALKLHLVAVGRTL